MCVCRGGRERERVVGRGRGWMRERVGGERGGPSVAERERRKGNRGGEYGWKDVGEG